MRPPHLAMALLVALIWGFNFVVIHTGLAHFPPLFLVSLRFFITALPAVFVKRPAVAWPWMIAIGLLLFAGQFSLLFSGMAMGMPAGLASIVAQAQAFFTIPVAFVALRERPLLRQVAGTIIAFAGLVAILASAGADAPLAGILLCLAAAFSWSIGNVLLRGAGQVDMFAMMIWLSLVPPVPLLGLSFALEGRAAMLAALAQIGPLSIFVLLYLAFLSTVLAYGLWGHLLKLYPVATVAPFSMLVPIFGALAASLLLGERFGPVRLAGAALVMAGLAVVALPIGPLRRGWGRAVAGLRG